MSKRRLWYTLCILVVLPVLVLAACQGAEPTATPVPSTPEPSPSPTAEPETTLTVCLGQEPTSLYPVDNPSASARSVLAALYDGPIDQVSYGYVPVILETLPSLENGEAQLFQVAVYTGDEVVDADGTPVTLAAGIRIRPAGCRSGDCAVEYDGRSEVEMDQMAVTFRLLPGLLWSDGEALTASDSVFSFRVAQEAGSSYLAARTQSYEAADETTVQWWGRPGFIDPSYMTNFFMPFPEHLWGSIPVEELSASTAARWNPAGWGPFMIEEWLEGEAITLVKNPHYFRAAEGLPKIDVLVYRFTPDSEAAIADLLAGKCDVIDPSVPLDGQAALLRSLDEQGQLQAFFGLSPVMEQLAFGIQPAEYDNGYNPQFDRPDYFGDVRVRQAIAYCIDRQQIVEQVLGGLTTVPAAYVPEGHPLFDAAVETYGFSPETGAALLEEAGWRDLDGDPATPRQAWDIAGISNGRTFELTLVTTGAAQRLQVSSLVAASLAGCGIQVDVQVLDQAALYASGPEGVLFGRNFELAEYAMGSLGIEPPCEWYTSAEIPGEGNVWVGTNLGGYANPEFDLLCSAARQSLPDEAAYADPYRQAQALFARELPSLPLYWRIRAAAAGLQVCGFSLDATASSGAWNIESIAAGPGCAP